MEDALKSALEHERRALEAKRHELEHEISQLNSEIEAVSFRLGHVTALLRGPEIKEVGQESKPGSEETEATDESTDPVEIAYRYLEEHGAEPVYYRELADVVKERGGELEGADPAITLVSRLVADNRFVRPFRRGWYALRVHYPKVKSVGARKSRQRKPTRRR
jgi:hypothetical protein